MTLWDIVFFIGLFLAAFLILYRAIKKKSWCPDIYGADKSCMGKEDKTDRNKKRQ